MNTAIRTSRRLSALQEGKQLHAIIEESQQKEGSNLQNKSLSEHGARPGTPEFTLVESDNLDGEVSENDHEDTEQE